MYVDFVIEDARYALREEDARLIAGRLQQIATDETLPDYWTHAVAAVAQIERALEAGGNLGEPIELLEREGDAVLQVLDQDEQRYNEPSGFHRALRRWLGHPDHPEHD
jgi:hypothetical protein